MRKTSNTTANLALTAFLMTAAAPNVLGYALGDHIGAQAPQSDNVSFSEESSTHRDNLKFPHEAITHIGAVGYYIGLEKNRPKV